MVAQTPNDTLTPAQLAQRWREDAYAAGCHKRIMVRPATALERQNGESEHVLGEIIMRLDQPGVYYDAHGKPVDSNIAQRAGFPVERQRREGEKARRLAEAKAKIEAEFAAQADAIEAEADAPASA